MVEGPEESVIEYVRKLQGLRWQQMVSLHAVHKLVILHLIP